MSKNVVITTLSGIILGAAIFGILVMPKMPASLSVQKTSAIRQTVVDAVKKSIVVIETLYYGVRSGVVLNEDGLVVTLESILNKKNVLSGYVGGDQVSLKNLHRANDGLAFLRIAKSGLGEIAFSDEAVKAGQTVFLITIPSADQSTWTVVRGTVSEVRDEIIVTDIPTNPTLSSSPLFTENGELLGIVDVDINSKVIAISASKVKALMDVYQ